MKLRAKFSGLYSEELGVDLISKLRAAVPDGRSGGYGYEPQIYVDDPRYNLLRQLLQNAGLKPWIDKWRLPNRREEFVLDLWREYEPGDFGKCSYVRFNPPQIYKLQMGEAVAGMISLNEGELDPKFSFLGCGNSYFCSERAKRLIQPNKYIGLSFKPTILRERLEENSEDVEIDRMGNVIPWLEWGQPWWQMVTDRVMPPLSSSMTFIKSRLKESHLVHPPLDDPNYSYTPYDGPYSPVELRYRLSDLEKLGPLDFARTLEPLNGSDHPIIVSKRFYDLCVNYDLECGWVPVRVHSD